MAQIQWYPGHMHKAAREIREVQGKIDMFLELLDARIPFSSENPMLESLRGNKPGIKVMTKSDLADPDRTVEWQNWFWQQNATRAIPLTTKNRPQISALTAICRELFPDRDVKQKPICVMVIGIPNVGKSSLINILADRVIAKTGNEAALTRHQQRIPLDNGIVLMDTPGVLWPNLENPNTGMRLAATGAIRDSAISHQDVAWYIAEFLLTNYPERVSQRYQQELNSCADPMHLLEVIGKSRGCLRKGGQIDLDRVAKILIHELRDGSLGVLTLETPDMMCREKEKVEQLRKIKADKKSARKRKWKKTDS